MSIEARQQGITHNGSRLCAVPTNLHKTKYEVETYGYRKT